MFHSNDQNQKTILSWTVIEIEKSNFGECPAASFESWKCVLVNIQQIWTQSEPEPNLNQTQNHTAQQHAANRTLQWAFSPVTLKCTCGSCTLWPTNLHWKILYLCDQISADLKSLRRLIKRKSLCFSIPRHLLPTAVTRRAGNRLPTVAEHCEVTSSNFGRTVSLEMLPWQHELRTVYSIAESRSSRRFKSPSFSRRTSARASLLEKASAPAEGPSCKALFRIQIWNPDLWPLLWTLVSKISHWNRQDHKTPLALWTFILAVCYENVL